MSRRIEKVVILGGGTAGWMTAAYLGKALQGTAKVTVLEAPAIPKIGVGEATIPNLQRVFFDYLGIPEDEWMRECNASFKMAVKFINWKTAGPGSRRARVWNGSTDSFYHPFGILPDHDRIPLSHLWAYQYANDSTATSFDYSCFIEPPLMDAKLAPRFSDGRPAATYAWHFDAHLVADYLRRFATERLAVQHVQDKMTDVDQDERGFITALRTEAGRVLTGDLFVDCSGFRGALINQVLKEPFIEQSDFLLCDSAVACPIPHDDASYGIEPYTSAIAMQSGWVWKTPMLTRFGSGYVYSSRFIDGDQATRDFCRLWGINSDREFNRIRFRVGRNRRSWVKNCVSIGLSSCFLEPLESSGLYFTYAAIYQLAKHFPDRNFDEVLIRQFNKEIAEMYDDSRDFIQAHFALSPRDDTPFWKANKELAVGEQMQEKLAMYRAGLPVNPPTANAANYYGNFENEFRNFWTNGSYYCIFTGLGVLPDHSLPALMHKPASIAAAQPMLAQVQKEQQELTKTLPTSFEYLRTFHGE
jgi:hypothetical protein